MKYVAAILVLSLLLSNPAILTAQYKRTGIPFVTNFSPLEYKAGNQNWAITQDVRGIMYFGNSNGLMEFDGTTWKIIDPVKAIAFAKDQNEKIYVGGRNDFGYLAPDAAGNIKYVSLVPLVPEPYKSVNEIWDLVCIGDKVYFPSSNGKLYIYDNGKISVTNPGGILGNITWYKNKIFLECMGGLHTLENNIPVKVKGGDLVNGLNIRNMFDFGEDTLLIVTRSYGLFIYHNDKISKWETAVSPYLEDYQVYLATQLLNGYIAFGTVESGVIIMDKKGYPTQHINRYGGMINDDHCGIFTDKQGNIWSGLEFGISYLHVNSPWSVFNELAGLSTATFYSAALFNNRLYAGNAQGLFSKSWGENENPMTPQWKFVAQPGLDARKVWDIIPVQNDLIFSSSNVGTYCIGKKPFYKIVDYTAPFKFFLMSDKRHVLGAGEHAGIFVFKNTGETWRVVSENKKIEYIESFEEDKNGHIWAAESTQKIMELTLKNDSLCVINTYDTSSGLPPDVLISVFKLNGKILVGSEKGTYEYDDTANKFKPCDPVNSATGSDVYIESITPGKNGKIWLRGFCRGYELTGYFEKSNGEKITCKLISKPLNKISEFSNKFFFPADDNNIFIGSSNCLVHFDPEANIPKPFFNVMVRYVSLPICNDSMIFSGAFFDKNMRVKLTQDSSEKISIPYELNSIKIGFSATYYEDNLRNTYSYKLNGFDAGWSSWSKKTEKEYTNLPEGSYTFLVKAQNLYGSEAMPASYTFIVKPPWYRTIAAYFAYLILFILLVYVIVKINIRKIQKEKIKLEKIVQLRTAEVVRQKDEISLKNVTLEQQKEEILAQNEALNQQNEEITAQRDEIEAQRDLVTKQKVHIESINKEITDSIYYAKQIQAVLLPGEETSRRLLGEHFIFFRPKDIVSGDFYWVAKIGNNLIVAVADCTGHGVPGAFMSMLGISFLNEIVRKQEVTNAAEVLNHLRMSVIEAMQQTWKEGSHKDGMDMSIVVIQSDRQKILWAGANNPLYVVAKRCPELVEGTKDIDVIARTKDEAISLNESADRPIRNDGYRLFEVKADKMPVAIHVKMDTFMNHEIHLEPGDRIYLFSDGFPDQFGGPKGKKFKYKPFKRLIAHTSNLSMAEQGKQLEKTFLNWINHDTHKYDQIDDVTVIGLKI